MDKGTGLIYSALNSHCFVLRHVFFQPRYLQYSMRLSLNADGLSQLPIQGTELQDLVSVFQLSFVEELPVTAAVVETSKDDTLARVYKHIKEGYSLANLHNNNRSFSTNKKTTFLQIKVAYCGDLRHPGMVKMKVVAQSAI